jgi:predicted phage terminase large subunit-like protein
LREEALALGSLYEKQLLEEDLFEFTKDAWKTVEPNREFQANWHLEAVCDHLQQVTLGEIKKLVINIPPRHLKSMTVQVFWPAWAWAKKPEIKWLCVAYGRSLVIRDATKCRRVIRSDWYQDRWGSVYQLSEDQNVKYYYENDKGGARLIGSFEGGVTGEGGDVLVVDDPSQLEDAENMPALEKAIEVWDGALATRLNDPVNSSRVIIMQRLNENDLTGHVLKEGGWTHLYLPAVYEPKNRCRVFLPRDVLEERFTDGKQQIIPLPGATPFFEDPRTFEGELLDPVRFPQPIIDGLRARGDLKFNGQQQQRPSSAKGNIFKRDWFRHYITLPPGIMQQYDACISLDCSFKDLETSSFVVMTVWVRRQANIYLLHCYRKKMDFPQTLKAFEDICNRFPNARVKYVEDKANGTAVISSLKNKISGIIAVSPEGGKESRAQAVTYLYQAGNVWHPEPEDYPWVKEFESELANFPRGTYNDQVDSTTQALYHHFHLRPEQEYSLMDLLQVGQNEPMMQGRAKVF